MSDLSYAEALQRVRALESTFHHTHQALYFGGVLHDACAVCGFDLRDEVHSGRHHDPGFMDRMIADRGRLPASISEALNSGDGSYHP